MKKRWADKWIKALRSGNYSQAKERLYNGEGYCCLGVLCKIAGKKFVKRKVLMAGGRYKQVYCIRSTKEFLTLPPSVMNITGMRTHLCSYDYGQNSLTSANDNGIPFDRIARIIELNWRDL